MTLDHSEGLRDAVLVVDDEDGVRRFAARVLRDEGFKVWEAANGAEALELVGGEASDSAVVVSDIVMPQLNGVQLLERLATLRPDLPVILMSGYGTAQLAEQGIVSPCGVLGKPFSPDVLLAEVRRCIGSQLT